MWRITYNTYRGSWSYGRPSITYYKSSRVLALQLWLGYKIYVLLLNLGRNYA
jgi:hypothetical protein